MTLVFVQLRFEALEQCERVGCCTGKSRQHLAMMQLSNLARRALDDNVAQSDLPVATDRNLNALRRHTAHAEDGRSVKCFHENRCRNGDLKDINPAPMRRSCRW